MKKTKNLIIIGVVVFLAVAAATYFTMGEDYQGRATIQKESVGTVPFMYNVEETVLNQDVEYNFAQSNENWVRKIQIPKFIQGCKAKNACNYNKDAMVHNALDCIYPTPGYNCMGEPTQADIDAAQRYLDNR